MRPSKFYIEISSFCYRGQGDFEILQPTSFFGVLTALKILHCAILARDDKDHL